MIGPRAVRTFTLFAVTSLYGVVSACGGNAAPARASSASATAPGLVRAVGVVCAFAKQCASGACSADLDAGGCGVCLEVRPLGQRCDGMLLTCGTSAVCRDGVCSSTKNTVGQPCMLGGKGDSSDCDDELYCVGPAGQTGTCQPNGIIGGACSRSIQGRCAFNADCERGVCVAPRVALLGDSCEERQCEKDLRCQSGAGGLTCERPTVLPEGAPCGGEALEKSQCVAGTSCELTTPGAGGAQACVADLRGEEECSRGKCAEDLFCADLGLAPGFRCQRRRTEGESCHESTASESSSAGRAGALLLASEFTSRSPAESRSGSLDCPTSSTSPTPS